MASREHGLEEVLEDDVVSEADEDGQAYNEDGTPTSHDQQPERGESEASEEPEIAVADICTDSFEELRFNSSHVVEARRAWAAFLASAESREVAGEVFLLALLEAAPSLQAFFSGPRAIIADRFITGFITMFNYMDDPRALKAFVEQLGFHHLHLEVTVPRVKLIRDATIDFLGQEARNEEGLSTLAHGGITALLNYAGGAFIYIREKYAPRIAIISRSWACVRVGGGDQNRGEEGATEGELSGEEVLRLQVEEGGKAKSGKAKKDGRLKRIKFWGRGGAQQGAVASKDVENAEEDGTFGHGMVPTNFPEMFKFNAAVMGFGVHMWMIEILNAFDKLVASASNAARLQEECDVLSLKLGRLKGNIDLSSFKAIMLASLRSLLPRDWSTEHEAAWSWLWDSAERLLKASFGQPAQRRKALSRFFDKLTKEELYELGGDLYVQFFAISKEGQEFFKQSNTRLHFIAGKILEVIQELFEDPHKVVEDISGIGLRHVGYGAPADLFGAFVTGCSKAVHRVATDDAAAEEAFTWAMSLVARILGRAVDEGSTAVMKAINANSAKMLRRAVSCAPRCERSSWVLNVQVGTQSISPLGWALESGRLMAAQAILEDLLTIRADRERYYYGVDLLFQRHPDIVQRLIADAPGLLPILLDRLIWRSRLKRNGKRKANYYIQHILLDKDNCLAPNLSWLAEAGDAKAAVHPVISLVTDLVWTNVAFRTFAYGKIWLLFTLSVFVLSQSVLCRATSSHAHNERIIVMSCRAFIYAFSLGRLIYTHVRRTVMDLRMKNIASMGYLILPRYLLTWQDICGLILTVVLFLMLCTEPVLFCLQHYEGDFAGAGLFTDRCPEAQGVRFFYSVLSTIGIVLYSLQTLDLAVCSTRFSAFVLICGRLLPELFLFLFVLTFVIAAFGTMAAAFEHHNPDYQGIEKGSLSFMRLTLFMSSENDFSRLDQDWLMEFLVFCFMVVAVLLLMNILICQLIGAYDAAHEDMVGIARLNRAKVVVETMPYVARSRWDAFVAYLKLGERQEFNEGDLGLPGCMVVWESAEGPQEVEETIRRYGGSHEMAWPKEDTERDEPQDRFVQMEKLLHKAMRHMSEKRSKKNRNGMPGSYINTSGGSGSTGSYASSPSFAGSERDDG